VSEPASRPSPLQALLDRLGDALDDALVVVDGDGIVQGANAVTAQLTADGAPPAVGMALADLAADDAGFGRWVRETLAGTSRRTIDLSCISVLATTQWECALSPMPSPDGDRANWLFRARDITSWVDQLRAARTSEEHLELLTAQMHELFFLIRIEGRAQYRCEAVNAAYLAATGLREEDVVGKLPEEVLTPTEAAFAVERYGQALRSPVPITYREVVHLPSGRLVVDTCLTVRRDAMGRATHLVGLAHNVTDVELTAEALKASEARLRGVLDAGFDAFAIARAVRANDGRISDFVVVDVNQQACALVGREREELIGQSLLEMFPLSKEWGLWEQCCRVVIERQRLEATQHAPTDAQPLRWLQRQLVPLDGDAVAISSRDITERQLERLALEASEARHRQLFENNGAIQLLADADSARIVDVNPAGEAFYGWSRATMREMFVTDLESIALDHWREITAGIATGTGMRVQREHRVANGQRRQVEAFIGVAEVDRRRVLHIIIQDITDRVRAEAALRESEARFRAVINEMREGVVLHDDSGAIRMSNPSAERILGLSAAQLTGLQPIDRAWGAVHADGSPWPVDQHPAYVALRTGKSQPRALMGVKRGDGDLAWLSVTADPLLRQSDGVPYASVAVFTDVTETRASEERLRQAQKLEAVAQLAGGIAHDFNNLLTVMRGATGFLREGLGDTSPHIDDVAAIERATERAEELTRRLLAVGRRQMLRTESVELNQLLRDQLPVIRNDLPMSIVVQLELAEQPVSATLDRSRLLDALRALVDNARAAMPDGGTLVLRTAEAFVPHPHDPEQAGVPRHFAMLEVRDTGVGMSEEVRVRLFEPFFSTQPFGANRGMGLASVHGMVHQSRGFLECDSSPGAGTALRLFLPLAGAPRATPISQVAVSPDARTGVVLLVDDDPMLRDLGRRMLEKSGEVVHLAESGSAALAFLAQRASEVSVLVTDLTMPGMSGLDLIRQVAASYPAIPVIAISGFAVDPDARAQIEARRIPFVPKPFTMDDLVRAIARVRSGAKR
jgi:PAS domain S-box-containing protein